MIKNENREQNENEEREFLFIFIKDTFFCKGKRIINIEQN